MPTLLTKRPSGGTGRRAGFKILYFRVCRFDSGLGYKKQSEKQSESDVGISAFFLHSHFLSFLELKRPWVFWSWIIPVVSLWFPKNLIEDLLKANGSDEAKSLVGKDTRTWWLTWVGFALVNNVGIVSAFEAPQGYVPIRPELELAGACLLTGAYLVWIRIVKALDR